VGVVGFGSGLSQSSSAMFSWICLCMAVRSTGAIFGSTVGAVGEGVGGGRGGSGSWW